MITTGLEVSRCSRRWYFYCTRQPWSLQSTLKCSNWCSAQHKSVSLIYLFRGNLKAREICEHAYDISFDINGKALFHLSHAVDRVFVSFDSKEICRMGKKLEKNFYFYCKQIVPIKQRLEKLDFNLLFRCDDWSCSGREANDGKSNFYSSRKLVFCEIANNCIKTDCKRERETCPIFIYFPSLCNVSLVESLFIGAGINGMKNDGFVADDFYKTIPKPTLYIIKIQFCMKNSSNSRMYKINIPCFNRTFFT